MPIQNMPAALQPIIQQGFLEREFQQALTSRLGYRAIADRIEVPVGVGETITKTRAGLKPAVTTPLAASSNTNLDNGLTPGNWGVEQYTLSINQYAATMDLNMVTSRVGIVSQFLQNAYANGEQARRSLDDLARNALFAAYCSGNTRVRATSSGTSVTVDDIRGFQYVPSLGGFTSASAALAGGYTPTWQPVSTTNSLAVTIGTNLYTVTAAAADTVNVSTIAAFGGVSGTLTLGSSILTADGAAATAVTAANAPSVIRPSGVATTAALGSTNNLTMSVLLDAVAKLRLNAVPDIGGAYNCYLDPVSARQLFSDADFKQLYQGATGSTSAFREGMTVDFLGLRFIPTTEAYVQTHPTSASLTVRRPIICGQGALIEGDFAGMMHADVAPADSMLSQVDGIVMVTREPLDRLQQTIAQSWYWMGGFTAPTDITTNPMTIPTATNAVYKRAVMIEHV